MSTPAVNARPSTFPGRDGEIAVVRDTPVRREDVSGIDVGVFVNTVVPCPTALM